MLPLCWNWFCPVCCSHPDFSILFLMSYFYLSRFKLKRKIISPPQWSVFISYCILLSECAGVHMFVSVRMCHGVQIEVRGQPARAGSLLPRGSQVNTLRSSSLWASAFTFRLYVSMKAFDPSLEAGHEQQPALATSALGGVGSLELTGRSAQSIGE